MRNNSIRTFAVAAVVASLALVACDDSPTEPPEETTAWSAELASEGEFVVTGTAAAESAPTSFVVEIAILDGDEGETYGWYVGAGPACGELTDRLGGAEDYAALEPDENGEAAGEAEVGEGLDAEEEYHVAVLAADESEVGYAFVSCGALTLDD